jgi:hypothetical protein
MRIQRLVRAAYEEGVGRSGKKVSGSVAAKPGVTLVEVTASGCCVPLRRQITIITVSGH